MITYLKVRNLAIVEEFAIEPGAGLNVLTGETGAGKSLLIDSLEFLRGARGSTEMIRGGAERMTAEAVFDVPRAAGDALDEIGVDAGEADVIVKREIATNGRGRVLINGSPLSVRELGVAMDAFLEIHGQHEAHGRVAGQGYRELLDDYGDHAALAAATREAHEEWREAANQLRELTDAQRDRTLRLDLLRYQIDEISAAKIDPGEEESLRGERSMLANARQLAEATSGAFALVDDDESSALAQLSRALHLVEPLAKEIADIATISAELTDAIYRLQETSRGLSHLSDSVRHDPARLEEIEDRLVTIERLKKKYGGSVEAVLAHLGGIQDEFERLSDYETSVDKLQRIEEQRFAAWRKAAEGLSAARKKSAKKFESAIQSELNDLAMERTTVKVVVDANDASREHAATHGIDRIEILIAPNRGEEPKPMQRIASGGELSRIQLAIAAALFKASNKAAAATLVFDEIDAGIGGRVAEVVGRKLQELAGGNQVICVTHLPQIASFGTTHFFVWKEDTAGHTRARIRKLESEDERVNEVARMLGGETIPASAVMHARELLDGARGRPAKARR
ncbi:MAG TPA: DNA repair protein RecN [Thermoanaerobaculia bacterium]|jgi:DNA repair protein RecN (Recombination protein N)|nr:DNA repair protein RecN [Thermoanaerobaculia bacterium]